MLEEARAAYPNFKVVPRSIAKSNKMRPHLRVSYAYMERYILSHEKAEERMKEYKEIRFRAECHGDHGRNRATEEQLCWRQLFKNLGIHNFLQTKNKAPAIAYTITRAHSDT